MAKDDDTITVALAALRRKIDEVDDGLHELLMRRAELVEEVARVKHRDDVVAFRPGREAQILRRLAGRHHGRFPRGTMVRLWREIMGSALAAQADLTVAVCDGCRDLARDHFGTLIRLLPLPAAEETMLAVAEGRAALGVLPLYGDAFAPAWWLALGALDEPRPAVVARLPFGALGNAAGDCNDAVVIAAMTPEASGDDCTLLIVESELSGAAPLTDTFLAAGLDASPMARGERAGRIVHLVEIEGFVEPGDSRLVRVAVKLGRGGRIVRLGCYARPLPDALMGGVAPE